MVHIVWLWSTWSTAAAHSCVCVCVCPQPTLLLQRFSCRPYLLTCGLPLKIINKCDDMIFLPPCWQSEIAGKINCPSSVVCILFISMTYSTDTDINSLVKCWYASGRVPKWNASFNTNVVCLHLHSVQLVSFVIDRISVIVILLWHTLWLIYSHLRFKVYSLMEPVHVGKLLKMSNAGHRHVTCFF